MSSKSIYGVRMPGTMGDVIHQLDGLRPLIAQKAGQLIARAVARLATDYHDRAVIFGAEGQEDHMANAYAEVQHRIAEMASTNGRDPEIDTHFEVVICDDGHHAVMISFTEHEDWFTDLLSLPGASDFSYWDGAGQPEDVSAEEWSNRRRTYQRILSRDPHGRPAGCGVTLVFQKPIMPPTPAEILREIPDRETRARRMARQSLLAEWASTVDIDQMSPEAYMKEMMTAVTNLNGPDHVEAISIKATDIEAILPEIDEEGLKGSIRSADHDLREISVDF
jgi:hypothetical protein